VSARYRPSFAEVDLTKLIHNFRLLQSLIQPGSFFCPMIKANAYGHGDIEVGRTLRNEGASHLGVALIEEAIGLRQSGDREPILIFSAFEDEASAQAIHEFKLTTVAGSWGQLEALRRTARSGASQPTPIHLEFNTGMNRLGFAVAEAPKLRQWFEKELNFQIEGVCTHLLHGEDASSASGFSGAQIEQFQLALKSFHDLPVAAHILNSSGAAAFSQRHEAKKFGFRPGIALYGSQPSSEPELALSLKAALSLKSKLVSILAVPTGKSVSYDATWVAKRDSVIGIVPFGYADGFSRRLSNRGAVLCAGMRVPVVGTVCMDFFMIDLTDLAAARSGPSDLAVGTEIVLIGEQAGSQGKAVIRAEDIAELCATISYEIFTSIGQRVPRIYIRPGVQ
jgi:alanine racemase